MEHHLEFLNPEEQPETELTFETFIDNLNQEEREVVYNFIGEIEDKLNESKNRTKFLKSNIKRYIELKKSPFSITSDELVEINKLEKTLTL